MMSRLPHQSPETINWDPDSDSVFYNTMMENEAVPDDLYESLDFDEAFLLKYIKLCDDHKVFGINGRMKRYVRARNWQN